MDPILFAILLTFAIKTAWESGKTEFAHVRDQRAAELRGLYPGWSPKRIDRMARKAARGYWWDQIRRGFPETKAAYAENKERAKAARIEGETAGLQRRAEIRDRIRKALADAEEIRVRERARAAGGTQPDAGQKAGTDREATKAGADKAAAKKGEAPDPKAEPAQARDTKPEPAPDAAPDPATVPPTDPAAGSGWFADEPDPEKAPTGASRRPEQAAPRSFEYTKVVLCGLCEQPVVNGVCSNSDCPYANNEPAAAAPPAPPVEIAPIDPGDHHGPQQLAGAAGTRTNVIPLNRPQPPATATAAPTEGEDMTTIPSGEYLGYEPAVADWASIKELSSKLLSHYESLMASYRHMKVDDATVMQASACHEAEEQHLLAVQAAADAFTTRHGAVKETKDATGTQGDQAVYN